MTLRRVYEVKNNRLIINLPDNFKDKKKVLVTVDDAVDTKAEKISLMESAASDPLFMADIKEINDDFGGIEHETL
jgi:hypothetical protein